jgi:hypothetical protein
MILPYLKVIIWGYPLGSHTHSYVHEAYYRAFKSLGYETYWFDDNNFPDNFNYDNCLFISEGFADKNIPINKTSCYLIMHCPSPIKYQDAGRYIDVRLAGKDFKDHVHEYSLNKEKAIKIGPAMYFEPKTNNKVLIVNDYVNYEIDDFDKLYISWATNKLPNEFNYDDIDIQRDNIINFCGSLSRHGDNENYSVYLPFITECEKNNIKFIHNCPWSNPLSNEEVIKRSQQSIITVDLRGTKHLKEGVVTCRIFKNISHGHLGLTNSKTIFEELDGNCFYNDNPAELFYIGMSNKNNFNFIKNSMKYVQENHTYINRINSIISIL